MNSSYPMHMVRPVEEFMYKVYGWMFAGLAVTAVTSFSLFHFFPEVLYKIVCSPAIWVLLIAQVGLVIALSAAINKLNYASAAAMFLAYSFLTGISLSPIFFVYTLGSIYTTFFVASGMFGGMALYGYFTQTDLTTVGSIARMGIYGLILAMFVNYFVGSSHMEFIISIAGVIIFTLLTAHDVQKIKGLSMYADRENGMEGKIAILGALTLYLDFINLFLYLLRLMGNKKRD